MRIKISNTGRQSGYGKDRYKKVAGLTAIEKSWALEAYDAPRYLCFLAERLSGGGNKTGTLWRWEQTSHSGKYWNPRVPPLWLQDWLVAMTTATPNIVEVGICKIGGTWHCSLTDENGVSRHIEQRSESAPSDWSGDTAMSYWCKP